MSYSNQSAVSSKWFVPERERPISDNFTATILKRSYDVFFSFFGLALLSPLILLIAVLVKCGDRGPIFYRQRRVGLHGRTFFIYKFRTMVTTAETMGPSVTRDGDARITRNGRFLRKTKLDELPQLWNVLVGDMSLVGPRPEVPKYVDRYTAEQRAILARKPGITDLASLYFRDEEALLKNAENVEEFYVQHCIPRKLSLNLAYAQRANILTDTWIILQTICPYWICMLTLYSLVLSAVFCVSSLLLYNFSLPPWETGEFSSALIAVVAVQMGCLIWRKQCKGLVSYFSLPELRQTAAALGFACLVFLCLSLIAQPNCPPRNLLIVHSLLSLMALGGFRLLMRSWREMSAAEEVPDDTAPSRVGIIGAGTTGIHLARQLMEKKHFQRKVVAFFDDDYQKWSRCIHDIPIVGMPECLLEGWNSQLDEVIVALPDASGERARQIRHVLQKTGIRYYHAPSAHALWGTANHACSREATS